MTHLVLWNDAGLRPASFFPTWMTPSYGWADADIDETDDAVVISTDVPGLAEEDLEITLTGRTLRLEGRGQRRGMTTMFRRTYQLAEGLDLDRIEASLERGVLTVRVPKTDAIKPRRIRLVDKVKNLLGKGEEEGTRG